VASQNPTELHVEALPLLDHIDEFDFLAAISCSQSWYLKVKKMFTRVASEMIFQSDAPSQLNKFTAILLRECPQKLSYSLLKIWLARESNNLSVHMSCLGELKWHVSLK
jgi:hypothetical protein